MTVLSVAAWQRWVISKSEKTRTSTMLSSLYCNLNDSAVYGLYYTNQYAKWSIGRLMEKGCRTEISTGVQKSRNRFLEGPSSETLIGRREFGEWGL